MPVLLDGYAPMATAVMVVTVAVDMTVPVLLDMLMPITMALAMSRTMSRTMDTDSARSDINVLCQRIAGGQD